MVCWSLEKQFRVACKVPSSLPSTKRKTQGAQHHIKNTNDKREAAVPMLVG